MATNSKILEILIKAKDEYTQTFTKLNSSLEKTSAKVKTAGTAMMDFGKSTTALGKSLSLKVTAPIVALGGFAVKSAGEMDSLKGAFDRLTKTANINGDALIEAMEKTSKGTISMKDMVTGANRAMALGIGKDIDTITTLMEIARTKGQSMGLSMTQAFNDIVTGIGRGSPMILDNLGIIVKVGEANEQYAQTLGKTALELTSAEQKQALLNAVVTSGKAEMEAMGEIQVTNKERMEQMTASLADFKDVLGAELLPYVVIFAQHATALIDRFKNLDAGQKKMVVGALALVAVLPPLLILVGMIAQGIGAMTVAFSFMLSPVGLVILAVGALIAIGVLLYKNWDTIKEKAKAIWGAIAGTIGAWLENVRNAITEKLNFIKLFFSEFFNNLLAVAHYSVSLLIGAFKLLLDWLFPGWQEALTLVTGAIKNGMAIATSIITTTLGTIKSTMSGAWDFIKGITSLAWGAIKDEVTASIGWVAGLINAVAEPLKQAWSAIWQGIKDITTGAWNGIKNAVKGGINWIIEKLNWFIKQANKIARAGNVVPGVSVPQLSQIPRLAKGGIVDSPTLAMIGEKGREAVVPLDGNTGLGNTIVINVTGNQLLNERDAEKLGDAILGKLKLGLNIA